MPAAVLLRNNFEGSNPWSGMAGYFTTAGGTVNVTPTYGSFGTIDAYGTSTASGGLQLAFDSSAASSNWSAGVSSGVLPLLASNTRTNAFLTLSFSLLASASYPVWVKVESFDVSSLRTGGLKALIYPAAPNFYQRFVIDLDTMTPDGAGVFNPTNPNVQISFQIDNTVNGTGWPNAATNKLQIDNINYATPKYYVKPSSLGGNDGAAGTSEATALATVQAAANKTLNGDNIIAIMDGADYVNGSINGDTVDISGSGTPEAWIVFKNYPGDLPVVRTIGWNTFKATTNSYIEIRGLDIRGQSYLDTNGDRQITAAYQSYVGNGGQGPGNGGGIFVDGRNLTPKPHHYRFADNIVEYCPGAGIGSGNIDRVTIEDNIVRNNCWQGVYAGSGISTLGNVDTETSATSIYRCLIQNNVVYGNENMMPWITSGHNLYSDGNGIILDSLGSYTGRTLIQNNLVYQSGGGGIQVFAGGHADVVHNTLYHNNNCPRLVWAQLFLNGANDTRAMNNIIVCQTNLSGSSTYNKGTVLNNNPTSVYLQNNLYWGGETTPPSGGNYSPNLVANPLFFSLSLDPVTSDYHVHSNSPALNYAQAIGYRSTRDLTGNPRSLTGQTDSGIYETTPGIAFAPVFNPQPGNFTNVQAVTLSCDTVSATMIYTTNGTIPTVDGLGNPINGFVYSTAIPVSAAITIQALAWKSGVAASYMQIGNYTFVTNLPPCATPTFGTAAGGVMSGSTGGTFNTVVQSIYFLTKTPGAWVRYTTDGSTPTPTTGTIAGGNPINVAGNTNFKIIAYNPESARPVSAVASATYNVKASIGNLSDGLTSVNFDANLIRFARFLNANTNVVTRIFARVGAIRGNYRAAIYSDNAGVPNAPLKASASAINNSPGGWQAFPLSAAQGLVANTYYWLAIWSDDSAATICCDTTGGTVSQLNSTFSSTWPSATGLTAVNSYNYSIYAMTDAANSVPAVSAGVDQTNTLPAAATLSGTATDDGVPLAPGTLSTTWSQVSGPGTVTFANSNSAATTATFSVGGTYVLQLVANDALLTSTDSVTVTVINPALIATTNTLNSSLNPATLGSNVTFTTTVTSASGTPAGTVTFSDGATALAAVAMNGSGVATFTTNGLYVGSHSISAAYGGNGTYAASTSPTLTQNIILTDGTTRLFAINAGGPAISGSSFADDTGFANGSTTSTTSNINLTFATNPAPIAVYQTERYATNFNYILGGLPPTNACLVRLHFSENWHGLAGRGGLTPTVGARYFNVTVNGTQRLTNFDIYAAAGAPNTAVVKEFATSANISGQVLVNFTNGIGSPDINALVDGLEVYTVTPFDAWRVANFTPTQLDNTNISGANADPDGDGMVNLVEYALGTNPNVYSTTGQPTGGTDGSGHATITFFRAVTDVTYVVEGTGSLNSPVVWSGIVTNPPSVGQSITVTDNVPANTSPRFLRVKFIH